VALPQRWPAFLQLYLPAFPIELQRQTAPGLTARDSSKGSESQRCWQGQKRRVSFRAIIMLGMIRARFLGQWMMLINPYLFRGYQNGSARMGGIPLRLEEKVRAVGGFEKNLTWTLNSFTYNETLYIHSAFNN